MRAFAGFIVRLVAYALVFGITVRVADAWWLGAGLDSAELQAFHDTGLRVLIVAPLVFAIAGFGALRRPAIFLAAFLVGVALTAPFAFSRFAGV